jgi:hypothetical protein
MPNEGIIIDTSRTLMKSEMIHAIHELGAATPDEWERSVFKRLTGHEREEVDWDFEDNQAGYYLWLKSFDQLVEELVDDGYVKAEEAVDGSRGRMVSLEADPAPAYDRLVYPSPLDAEG